MATMSAARIRSLCRRHNHAHEAVYHFSANPVQHVVTGFLLTRATETSIPFRRRAFPRCSSPGDGESGLGLIHRFAPLLNSTYRRQPPCR